VLQIDTQQSAEIQGTVLALKQMEPETRKRVYKATRDKLVPEWRQELADNANGHLDEKVLLSGARMDVSATTVKFKAAQSKKKMSGGAATVDIGHAIEFGGTWHRGEVSATSNRGKRYNYTRMLNKQLKPRRQQGHVAFPAIGRLVPRFAALWVGITVKTMYDALERKL
jgi:hypothetical protein